MTEYIKINPYIFKCAHCKTGDIEFLIKLEQGEEPIILIRCNNCGKQKEIPQRINYIYVDIDKIEEL